MVRLRALSGGQADRAVGDDVRPFVLDWRDTGAWLCGRGVGSDPNDGLDPAVGYRFDELS